MTILGTEGVPLAPPKVVELLSQIDEHLGLKFIPAYFCWAVTWRWPLDDPRWERVQTGEALVENAFDIFAWLPEDVQPEEVVGYLQAKFVRNTGRAEIVKLLDKLDEYNEKQQATNLGPTTELAEELVATNATTLFEGKHIPKSNKVGPKSKKDEKLFQEYLRDR